MNLGVTVTVGQKLEILMDKQIDQYLSTFFYLLDMPPLPLKWKLQE